MKINKTIKLLLILFSILLTGCSHCGEKDIPVFIEQYIQTVSHEHALHKQNITEKMTDFFMDYEHREKAVMPEFMKIGPFRNNILIISNYSIQKIEEIKDTDIGIKECDALFDVDVKFEILSENENIVNKSVIANYWIALYKNKLYIYADDFLQDIYILEKDIRLSSTKRLKMASLTASGRSGAAPFSLSSQ